MSKRMICSRATEDHIQALWCAWEWPHDQYLQEHHTKWLNTHCVLYWYATRRTLYFQDESDLQSWCVAHSSQPTLEHKVLLDGKSQDLIKECVKWCEQQWGTDMRDGNWPHGTWTYGYEGIMSSCMKFADPEQAVQFALVFT